jgi:hypothetical protein
MPESVGLQPAKPLGQSVQAFDLQIWLGAQAVLQVALPLVELEPAPEVFPEVPAEVFVPVPAPATQRRAGPQV